jgi:hypothetical protein
VSGPMCRTAFSRQGFEFPWFFQSLNGGPRNCRVVQLADRLKSVSFPCQFIKVQHSKPAGRPADTTPISPPPALFASHAHHHHHLHLPAPRRLLGRALGLHLAAHAPSPPPVPRGPSPAPEGQAARPPNTRTARHGATTTTTFAPCCCATTTSPAGPTACAAASATARATSCHRVTCRAAGCCSACCCGQSGKTDDFPSLPKLRLWAHPPSIYRHRF